MHTLVVGSCLVDIFIKPEDENHVELVDNKASLTLGDKIPIDITALSLGGNGANVAAAVKKAGISTTFYTYLGSDVLSKHIEDTLVKEQIELVIERADVVTASLALILNLSKDRIIFSHHNKRPHGFDASQIHERPDAIYLTSIGDEWESAYRGVVAYATADGIPIAFSPGSHQMKTINETFVDTVKASSMLFCNKEEAKQIVKSLTGNEIDDIKEIISTLKGTGLKLLSITDGGNGAHAIGEDNALFRIGVLPTNGHEKTGAGDAYAAAFLAAHLKGLPVNECMRRATFNSVSVMERTGAHSGLLTDEGFELASNTHTDFSAERIEL